MGSVPSRVASPSIILEISFSKVGFKSDLLGETLGNDPRGSEQGAPESDSAEGDFIFRSRAGESYAFTN